MTTLNIQNVTTKTLTALAISSFAFGANASIEPQQCENVRFADVGWTDITATTAVTSELLKRPWLQNQNRPTFSTGDLLFNGER